MTALHHLQAIISTAEAGCTTSPATSSLQRPCHSLPTSVITRSSPTSTRFGRSTTSSTTAAATDMAMARSSTPSAAAQIVRQQRRGDSSGSSTTAATAHMREDDKVGAVAAAEPLLLPGYGNDNPEVAGPGQHDSCFWDKTMTVSWEQWQQDDGCCCSDTVPATRGEWEEQHHDGCCLDTATTKSKPWQQHDRCCCSDTATMLSWEQRQQHDSDEVGGATAQRLLLKYGDGGEMGAAAAQRDGSNGSNTGPPAVAPLWQ
ncbi:hypothetical protein BDZ97DRAFT_1919515 [Flammula alnicola]|nr:hypothetical protein BDZ97DRAFT_1919515 [Flammula alnicola]